MKVHSLPMIYKARTLCWALFEALKSSSKENESPHPHEVDVLRAGDQQNNNIVCYMVKDAAEKNKAGKGK